LFRPAYATETPGATALISSASPPARISPPASAHVLAASSTPALGAKPSVPELDLAIKQRRAIMNNLRQLAAARNYFLKFQGRVPELLADVVGPQKAIRELKPVNGEDYTTVQLNGRTLSVTMADGAVVSLETEGPVAKGPPTLAESAEWRRAMSSYLQSRAGSPDPQIPQPIAVKDGAEFVGVRATQDGTSFALTDPASGTTHWFSVGQSIGSSTIVEYRAAEETLVLAAEGKTVPLKLRDAKVVRPFALETEMAYLALQEVSKREGWPVSVHGGATARHFAKPGAGQPARTRGGQLGDDGVADPRTRRTARGAGCPRKCDAHT